MDRVIKENIQKQENLRRGEISNKAFESSKMAGKDTCWQALSSIPKTHKVETEIWLPQVVLWPLQALLCMDITPHKHAHRKINKHKKIKLWIEYSPTTYPFWHLFSQPSFCISVLLITQKRSRKWRQRTILLNVTSSCLELHGMFGACGLSEFCSQHVAQDSLMWTFWIKMKALNSDLAKSLDTQESNSIAIVSQRR